MTPVTRVALQALDQMGGPRTVLAAVPGGAKAVAAAAGVSAGRVSQVLRQDPLPSDWAQLLARLIGCSTWEVYEQLGQRVTEVVTPAHKPRANQEARPRAVVQAE